MTFSYRVGEATMKILEELAREAEKHIPRSVVLSAYQRGVNDVYTRRQYVLPYRRRSHE